METYRITILNDISQKKRWINIEAYSFKKAVMQAEWSINNTSENIIKAVIWKKKD
jgi:RecA-family ATPase